MKITLKKSIIIFIVVALIALLLILNKGHIGTYSLVYTEDVPKRALEVEMEKSFISSVDKEVLNIKVYEDGEEIKEGYRLSSSDDGVVEINDDNKLQAVSNGKATIKVQYDGAETEFDVRVITPIKTLTFTTTSGTIRVGKDLQLKLKATPSDASIDSLKYETSDEEVAVVNANGIVTGVSSGKVTITVIDEYSGIKKTVNLTVKN